MLYHRDDQTGDHLVTHHGQTVRYASRAAAISAGRKLLVRLSAKSTGTENAA